MQLLDKIHTVFTAALTESYISGVKSPFRRGEEISRRGSEKETSNQSSSSEVTTNPRVGELVQDDARV